jgi:hypothetical protein
MAANRPPGDKARKGAVRKRSQLKTKVKARSIGRSEAVKMAIHGSEERPQGEAAVPQRSNEERGKGDRCSKGQSERLEAW